MTFDRRLTPARSDLAAAALRGEVAADRYVDPIRRTVTVPVADLRPDPRPDGSIDTQAILGEAVDVFETTDEGWAWVQLPRDGYVGWMSAEALGSDGAAATHRVSVPRTFRYPGPDLRLPAVDVVTMGARVRVTRTAVTRGTDYAVLADGRGVVARHLEPLDAPPVADFVAVARDYLGTPYLWGGRTGLGIDCSGLVQTALERAGIAAPRDSDMQERGLGERVDDAGDPASFTPGDLVFWKGHVGFVSSPDRLLHASGFHMQVVDEPLTAAIARIAVTGGPVTAVRRVRPR